ncbi:MAG: Ldh family oxidoreductase, partial [Alphaproteobacteria bacterium]
SGAMLAMGGTKGALLALIVELLCCALTGAAFGFEADSFFQDEGNRPRLGQALLVIDPGALSGADAFAARIETLITAMQADEGVRLPGAKRDAQSARASAEGIDIPDAVLEQIKALATP